MSICVALASNIFEIGAFWICSRSSLAPRIQRRIQTREVSQITRGWGFQKFQLQDFVKIPYFFKTFSGVGFRKPPMCPPLDSISPLAVHNSCIYGNCSFVVLAPRVPKCNHHTRLLTTSICYKSLCVVWS